MGRGRLDVGLAEEDVVLEEGHGAAGRRRVDREDEHVSARRPGA